DVLDEAVGGQHAVLIVAAEEGDLDLLALVLVRVVLQAAQSSVRRTPPSTAIRATWQFSIRVTASLEQWRKTARSGPPCETTSTCSPGCRPAIRRNAACTRSSSSSTV